MFWVAPKRYGGYQRNYNTSNYKKYRFGGKQYSNNKWQSNRRYIPKKIWGKKSLGFNLRSIKDETFAPERNLLNNRSTVDYITMPELGQGVTTRQGNRVKVWTVNLDGRVNIRPGDGLSLGAAGSGSQDQRMIAEGETVVDESGLLEGHLGIMVILDRTPSGQQLPTLADIFGELPNALGSMLDQHVRQDQLGRYKVLMKDKRYVNNTLHGNMLTINRYMKFSRRNTIVTTFKDNGGSTAGTYSNMKENAILVYVMWESVITSHVTYSINSRVVYYH